jgi:hypothetical protein
VDNSFLLIRIRFLYSFLTLLFLSSVLFLSSLPLAYLPPPSPWSLQGEVMRCLVPDYLQSSS